MKVLNKLILILSLLLAFISCNKDLSPLINDKLELNLSNNNSEYNSTPTANLVTEAIKNELGIDIVFYPESNLKNNSLNLNLDLTKTDINERLIDKTENDIKSLYDTTTNKDLICISYMKGSQIKDFIKERTLKNNSIDVHTSGIEYDITIKGGEIQNYNITRDGKTFDLDKQYKVAFIYYEYDYKSNFPGYYYGNGFNYLEVQKTDKKASDLVIDYLKNNNKYSFLNKINSKVTVIDKTISDENKIIPIYSIQGEKYKSEFTGINLKTRGIITAYIADSYNNDYGFYMQDKYGDNNDYTSDAIYVELDKTVYNKYSSIIKVGNLVEVEGNVDETYTGTGLTRTSLISINKITLREKDVTLPTPIELGEGGSRTIPNEHISTYKGNVNQSLKLNLNDGIGFWESLEGMLVKVKNPIVTGAEGGKNNALESKGYFNLFVKPNNVSNEYQVTPSNGLIIDVEKNDYNPEIIRLINHAYYNKNGQKPGDSSSFKNGIFNVGDELEDITGILAFNVNTFGDGEYDLLINDYITAKTPRTSYTPLADRPKATLIGDDTHLTIATFNVENMYATHEKIPYIAEIIAQNMKSPDIIVFTEIQDNNGPDNYGEDGSPVVDADETLTNLINNIESKGGATDYKYININPLAYLEGGEPGGNIRVAAIYRDTRVEFNKRGEAGSLDHAGLDENGDLILNPGRVYPQEPIFKGTRRSLAMEFYFKNNKIVVIGNHLNSKGGDDPLWGAKQPVVLSTEAKRIKLAKIIHGFVQEILSKDENKNIVVLGDFNEFYAANPMKVLKGNILTNLIETLPFNKRYSYNFQGNAQATDHILISKNLKNHNPEIEILPINTDYMGQYSDHNPVISRYEFNN